MFPLTNHLQQAPSGPRSLFQRGPVLALGPPEVSHGDLVSLTPSSDEKALSKSQQTSSPEKKRGFLSAMNWRRSLTFGLAGLSLFGSLVATVEAGDARSAKPSIGVQQNLSYSGNSLQGRLLMEDHVLPGVPSRGDGQVSFREPGGGATGGPTLAKAPQALSAYAPFQLSRPKALVGDYIKHGTNFSQLLTNQEFTQSDAATPEEIQSYFVSKGSFLAKYSENGQSANDIIATAAKDFSVNPWVLISTLEKENAIVTRQVQPRDRVMKASMGYGYTDGGKKIGKTNFEHQVRSGAELLSNLYQSAQGLSYPRKLPVDYGKHKVQIDNAATMALMLYTPHTTDTHLHKVGGGNYLFRAHLERFTKENVRFSLERLHNQTMLASSGPSF